jgi:hypothetical protein
MNEHREYVYKPIKYHIPPLVSTEPSVHEEIESTTPDKKRVFFSGA